MLGEILQPTHLIFILIVALLFLGPKRLPAAGRALGQGLREFKSSITGERTDEPQPDAVPERTESPSPSHDDAPAAANAHS
jgi:sec-independent protein translocase protein TatA